MFVLRKNGGQYVAGFVSRPGYRGAYGTSRATSKTRWSVRLASAARYSSREEAMAVRASHQLSSCRVVSIEEAA